MKELNLAVAGAKGNLKHWV